jgi:hypothetical protein
MAGKMLAARSAEVWTLVRRQHGVVARRQLLDLGFSSKAIEHRLAAGRLHPVGYGVYAVGRPALDKPGRWMAAVLACGPSAALSHRSAAALWSIGTELPGRIDLSVRRHSHLRRPGIRARSRPALPAADLTDHHGIPITTPIRTLIDVATELTPNRLERAVNEADKRDLVDPDALRGALDAHPGEPGVRPLRVILDQHTFRLSDAELELLFRPLAAAAGLPTPLTKQWVDDFEVDFFWPALGLVVETDGWRYHRTPAAQTRDARRFQAHTASGLTPLRFSHWQVKHEPADVRRILARTLSNLRRYALEE